MPWENADPRFDTHARQKASRCLQPPRRPQVDGTTSEEELQRLQVPGVHNYQPDASPSPLRISSLVRTGMFTYRIIRLLRLTTPTRLISVVLRLSLLLFLSPSAEHRENTVLHTRRAVFCFLGRCGIGCSGAFDVAEHISVCVCSGSGSVVLEWCGLRWMLMRCGQV